MQADVIESFFGLDMAQLAVAQTGFDLMEEFDLLVRLIRSDDPGTSLAALRHFRKIIKEIGQASGRIVSVKESRETSDVKGNRVRQEIESGAKLAQRLDRRPSHNFPIREQLPRGSDRRAEEA